MNNALMNVIGRLRRRSRNKRFQGQSAGLSLFLTMGLLLVSPATWAAVLDSISFATQSGDRFEILLGFDGAPPEPVSYAIESPARISIDLVGVQSQLEKKYYRIAEGSAQSVAVLEGEDRTRIIVSLPQMVPHEVTTLGAKWLCRWVAIWNERDLWRLSRKPSGRTHSL